MLAILDDLEQGGEGELPELEETLPTPTGVSAVEPVKPRPPRKRRRKVNSLTAADVAAVPDGGRGGASARATSVLTVGHENPDGDALGSALAVALAVEQLGGRATPVSSDPVPPMYGFMPHIERFRQDPEPGVDYDLIVVGDCGDLAARRLRRWAATPSCSGACPIVNIDHHISNPGFGAVDWIDPSAAATCEMDTLLMPALGVAPRRRGRGDRGQPDGRARHRHGQFPASQRHAADAARRR